MVLQFISIQSASKSRCNSAIYNLVSNLPQTLSEKNPKSKHFVVKNLPTVHPLTHSAPTSTLLFFLTPSSYPLLSLHLSPLSPSPFLFVHGVSWSTILLKPHLNLFRAVSPPSPPSLTLPLQLLHVAPLLL